MSRLLAPAASLMVAGALLLAPTTAQAATAQATATTTTRLATRVKVSSPSAIRRGGYAHYTFRVTRPDLITDDALVLETDFPRGVVSKVRFSVKPGGSACGALKRNAAGNYAVYCVVHSLHHSKLAMSFRAWVKPGYRGKFRVGHYWAPVTLDGGGSVRDYLDEISRADLIGHAWTSVR